MVDLGYQIDPVGSTSIRDPGLDGLLEHARIVDRTILIMGFYLQLAVTGVKQQYAFRRDFFEIGGVVAIKVAPFDGYRTVNVVPAVCDSGRASEVALNTGNDDNTAGNLLTR